MTTTPARLMPRDRRSRTMVRNRGAAAASNSNSFSLCSTGMINPNSTNFRELTVRHHKSIRTASGEAVNTRGSGGRPDRVPAKRRGPPSDARDNLVPLPTPGLGGSVSTLRLVWYRFLPELVATAGAPERREGQVSMIPNKRRSREPTPATTLSAASGHSRQQFEARRRHFHRPFNRTLRRECLSTY
jgi:hypothetical protein